MIPAQRRPADRSVARVVLAASKSWLLPGDAVYRVQRDWRADLMGPGGATLVVDEAAPGLAGTVAGLWRRSGGPVELAADLPGAVAGADMVLAFCFDLDPAVVAVLDAAHHHGVPAVLDHRGPYPFPPGSVQRERADAAAA